MTSLQNDGEDVVAGRALWKGFIHFGDTNVPVKLHTAVKENRLQFHLLHKRDRVRLQQQMICAYEKVPVPPAEQVRGFEVEEGQYILVDPAELEAIEPEATREIQVHEFVKAAQIDPIFMERTYYLEPDLVSKGYNALVELLQEMEINGICTWTMRKRSYFGALQASGKTLRLKTLRYADEVIPVASLNLQEFSVSEKELSIGSELINHLTVPFQPEKFTNEHQQKLQNLIDKKARGEKIVLLPSRPMKSTAPNKLLEALEASLKKVA
jgi:DNA end-binding protein Ku